MEDFYMMMTMSINFLAGYVANVMDSLGFAFGIEEGNNSFSIVFEDYYFTVSYIGLSDIAIEVCETQSHITVDSIKVKYFYYNSGCELRATIKEIMFNIDNGYYHK